MPTTTEEFCVVVPCFNEEASVETTLAAISDTLKDAAPYRIIAVDDGSTDRTAAILDDLSKRLPQLIVIHHDFNRGYGASLKSGIRQSDAEIIVITDADGSYPIDMIPTLLTAMADADMVVGARTGANVTYSRIRRIPKFFLTAYCSWITKTKIPDINSGLRAIKKSAVDKFLHILPSGFSFTTTITVALLTNDYRVHFVPIDYAARIGVSKIQPIRDTLRFCQLIVRTGIYFAPLRAFAPVIALCVVGFLTTLGYDIFVNDNITDKTLVMLAFTLNTTFFALLADLIDKRLGR